MNAADGPWSKAGLARSPGEGLAELGVSVNFVRAHSIIFFDRTPEKFDFIFLDGDHSQKTVSSEIPRALNHLNENGVILLHDYFPNGNALWKEEAPIGGPYMAVQKLQRDGANIAAVPLGTLPWPTKRGTNVTSLAALLAL